MTNYLDLLLAQQLERQEEADMGTWGAGAVRVPRPGQGEETPVPEDIRPPEQGDQMILAAEMVPAGGNQTAALPVRTGETEDQGLTVRLTDGPDRGLRPGTWDEDGTQNRVREDGALWSARRWIAGEASVNQAGVRMEEARQTARTAERADCLPDAPKAGQTMGDRSVPSGRLSRWETGTDVWGQAVYIPAGEQQTTGLAGAGLTGEPAGAASAGAEWLDRAVRVSLGGLPASDRQSKVVTLEPAEWDTGAKGLELRQLDRLVRRDARRFDGGFQLL